MSKVCVQCEKKIGLFKSPIEGIYCSFDCRNAARDALKQSERQGQERLVEAQRRAAEAAAEKAREAAALQAEAQLRGQCPKCGAGWACTSGGSGSFSGKCAKCLFVAEFTSVGNCPVCKCQSLVIASSGDARCPRCKYRGQAASAPRA